MTDFTVLVAVFNAERYLRQCLDSLLGQTLRSIEVICVDDASTDASADILQTYARNDCRVRVISRHTNAGAAKARNDGLRMARESTPASATATTGWRPTHWKE